MLLPLLRRSRLGLHLDGRGLRGRLSRGARAGRRRNIRSDGGLKLTLRIDEEVGRTHDAITLGETFANNESSAQMRPEFELARFEVAVAAIDKCDVVQPGLEHARIRNHYAAPKTLPDVHVDEHPDLQLALGIAAG